VIATRIQDAYDLGAEFLRWEIATAVAGFVLDIDPFDQPNVQESKDNTVRLLKAYGERGALPDPGGALSASAADFAVRFNAHLKLLKKGDYFALTAYVARTATTETLLREIRTRIRDRFGVATTVGYGPRFLHSTGQLHKGGAANGVFVQLSDDAVNDLPIPNERFTFGTLEAAQALGDYESLASRNRRALRVSLGRDVDGGLRALLAALGGGGKSKAGVTKRSAPKRAAARVKSKPKAAKKTAKRAAAKKAARRPARTRRGR
jgi:transaldolase/glucose-6-phosphate isomerase